MKIYLRIKLLYNHKGVWCVFTVELDTKVSETFVRFSTFA